MGEPPKSGDLFPGVRVPDGVVTINRQCMHQASGDRMTKAHAMVKPVADPAKQARRPR